MPKVAPENKAGSGYQSGTAKQSYTGMNIGNLMNPGSGNIVNEHSEKIAPGEEELPEQNETFTQADLESVWKEMAEKVAYEHPNLKHTLISREPMLHDDCRVVITVDNKIQDEGIFNNRPAIVRFLRIRLRNTSISIETVITDKPVESRRPYTDMDKFEAMARNAPDIRKLKDQLNLDIEM